MCCNAASLRMYICLCVCVCVCVCLFTALPCSLLWCSRPVPSRSHTMAKRSKRQKRKFSGAGDKAATRSPALGTPRIQKIVGVTRPLNF